MALQKDDPVYYKVKLKELIKQARENDLIVCLDEKGQCINFMCLENSEIASVYIKEILK